jgi:hypothetical protein
MIEAALVLILCAAPEASARDLDLRAVDPDRVGRALTLLDENTTGNMRIVGALTVSGGVVAMAMGAAAKYRWDEQLGGSYALIGGALSTAIGIPLLFTSPPIHGVRVRFEAERASSPELAVQHALESWRALIEKERSRRKVAVVVQVSLGMAMVLAGLSAVATPWFDATGSPYARHSFAEAFIPLGAALVAGGFAVLRAPPSPLEIGYELSAGIAPIPGGAAVGLHGRF